MFLNPSGPTVLSQRSAFLQLLSKPKTYAFALAIIVSLGGLATLGCGTCGYFHIGSLSNLHQIQAIVMMAAGGVGAAGGVASLLVAHLRKVKTQSIYGPEAWNVWRVEVLDIVPKAPNISWNETDPFFNEPYHKNFTLLYIPEKIKVNGQEQVLSLPLLQQISGIKLENFKLELESFNRPPTSGWVLISQKVIPKSENLNLDRQSQMLGEKGFRAPHIFEAVILNLLTCAHTGERLYRRIQGRPVVYARCTNENQISLGVGNFSRAGLMLTMLAPEKSSPYFYTAAVKDFK